MHSRNGFRALPGLGARGTVDGREVTVGPATLLRDDLAAVPDAIALARATFTTIRRNLA